MAVAIGFEVARYWWVCKQTATKGIWGHAPQERFGGYEIASETIFDQNNAPRRPYDRV